MRFVVVVLLGAAFAGVFAQQTTRAERTAADLDRLLSRIAGYEHGQSRAALAELTSFISGSLDSPALLRAAEGRLLEFLKSGATPAAKVAMAKELSTIATEASVTALAGMLTNPEIAEMARYALTRIPGPLANDALRKALDTTSGKTRIGIINSIGQRRDAKATPALKALISSGDAEVAEVAIAALGSTGDRSAMDALATARKEASGVRRERITVAYLRCAEGLVARGDKSGALSVYRQLTAASEPDTIRIAALGGLASLQGTGAVAVLAEETGSKSPDVQAAAINLLAGIPGPYATAAMVRKFPTLTPRTQARMVTALAERGDVSARPLLMQSAKRSEPEVRIAALTGLGMLGGESSIRLLAEAAASGQGAEQAAARESLAALRGATIDSAIVTAITSSTGKVKAELILAAAERRSAGAGNVVVQAAREQDPELRRSALRALRSIAGPEQVDGLLEVVQTSTVADRRDAAQALGAALRRSQAAQFDAVISAYRASGAVPSRLSLLDALGQAPRTETLPIMREGLNDPSPEIARSAILALTDWADPAPLADLLAVAGNSPDPALRTLALRGYLKLLALPSQRTNADTAKLLADGVRLATDPAEKRTALSLLAAYPSEEALKLAGQLLKDLSVSTEAKASVDRINNALKRK